MRPTTFVMTVFIGCGIPSIAACQSAVAAPLPQVAGGALGASVIEAVGYWKRYCRYNDCTAVRAETLGKPRLSSRSAAVR